LLDMILRSIDPEGMTWTQASQSTILRENYDMLLCRAGYTPLSLEGTPSSIHTSDDWTIPLKYDKVHENEIAAMIWKLYQHCLESRFSRVEYDKLVDFVKATFGEELH